MKSSLTAVYGEEAVRKIAEAKVFVVGAGGIGSELLKNLAKTGFKNIEVIDLDTIDVSNLNRQLLFRKCHVGRSKAEISGEAILGMTPGLNIKTYMRNVKGEEFGVDFIKKFNIVFNALDNLSARRHVNRLCLATKTPLIESGTLGYLGQVMPILPGTGTACYECSKKNTPKQYPVCTIRATPDKPVHCIAWAKHLLAYCFGPEADREGSILSDLKISTEDLAKEDDETIIKILEAIYSDDIKELLSMEDKWKDRKPPVPIEIRKELAEPYTASKGDFQEVLDTRRHLQQLIDSYHELQVMKKEHGDIAFDKDIDATMAFVSASSNLRMHCYGIPEQSLFTNKGIAGNIVHAIATTNAIIAGMMVTEGIKILTGNRDAVRACWLKMTGIQEGKLDPKNPKCYVCSKARVLVKLDTEKFSLKQFQEDLLKSSLGFTNPDINVLSPEKNYIEYGDPDLSAEYLRKSCKDIKIVNGCEISVEDFCTSVSAILQISHEVLDDKEHPSGFVVMSMGSEIGKRRTPEGKIEEDDRPTKLPKSNGVTMDKKLVKSNGEKMDETA